MGFRRQGRVAVPLLVAGALVAAGAVVAPSAEAATTVLTATATADTYADAANPTRNNGTAGFLLSRAVPGEVSYLRFTLPVFPAGTTLTAASLRVRTTTDPSAGSTGVHTIRLSTDTWTETGLTWNNQPPNTGAVLGTLTGATAVNTLYSAALATSPLVALSGGTLSITMASTATDGLYFLPRTASTANRPTLSLTFTTAAATDVTPPSAPSNAAAVVTGSDIAVGWTASTDDVGVTAYDVHRSTTQAFTPSALTLVGSTTTTSYTDTARPVGTWYYRVIARDAAGNASAASNVATGVVQPPPDVAAPSQVQNLGGTVTGTTVALAWSAATDNVGVTSYDIHRSAVAGFTAGPTTLLGSTSALAWNDTGVATGTWYYRVIARDLAGNASPPSSTWSGTVVPSGVDSTPPSTPTGLASSAPGTSPALSWSAATDDVAVTGYEVHRSTDPAFVPSATTLLGTTTALTLGDPNVVPGAWFYRVVALDAVGNRSTPSAALAVGIAAGAGTTVSVDALADTYGNAGAAGSNFGTSASLASRGALYVSWLRYALPAQPGSTPLSSVTLRLRTTTDPASTSVDTHTVSFAPDTWNESTLTWATQPAITGPAVGTIAPTVAPSTAYSAKLDATAFTSRLGQQVTLAISDTGVDSLWFWSRNHSNATYHPWLDLTFASSVVADLTPPTAPTGLVGTAGPGAAHLAWVASTDQFPLKGYEVEVSTDPAFPVAATTKVVGIPGTTYDDHNEPVGTYWYRVTAIDAAGNRSAASAATSVTITTVATDVTLVAVGDLVCTPGTPTTSSTCRHGDVAKMVAAADPDWFMPLGDIQYELGTYGDFMSPAGYDGSFAQFRPRSLPVVGNHEYADPAGPANGYFRYFDPNSTSQFGANPDGYYTRTIGSWRLIVINSECSVGIENAQHMLAGGCGVGSPEYTWLQSVLASSTEKCTLAAFHRPRWSSGTASTNPSSYPEMSPIWDLLVSSGVDVGISGHKHDSEVFAPIGVSGTGNPVADAQGMRQFVAGAGGKEHGPFDALSTPAGQLTLARDNATFGGLKLTLHADSYDWSFVPVAGQTFTNAGTTGAFSGTGVACH